jgi:Protein of unknown function (DUF3489)
VNAATAAKRRNPNMTTSVSEQPTETAPATATKKASAGKRRAHAASSKKATVVRHGGKTARILELLKRPGGVTLKELMKTTAWQAHSVRGFISGTVGKKMGKSVVSTRREDGERVYRLK